MTPARFPIALALVTSIAACAGEEERAPVPTDEVRSKIEAAIHVQGDTLAITDPRDEEPVTLTFDRVHETVAPTEGDRWVACVDYTDPDGTTWDLDYYVDDTGAGELRIEEIVIHRIGDETILSESARARLESSR